MNIENNVKKMIHEYCRACGCSLECGEAEIKFLKEIEPPQNSERVTINVARFFHSSGELEITLFKTKFDTWSLRIG